MLPLNDIVEILSLPALTDSRGNEYQRTFHCKQGGTANFVLVCSGMFFYLFPIKKKTQEKEGNNEKS
jgi:hypothetical protein